MNNKQYEEYLKRLIAEHIQQEQQNNKPFSRVQNAASKLDNYGQNISNVGQFIGNFNNPKAQAFGSNLTKFGDKLSNGASIVTNTLNAPQNYINGLKNQAIESGLSNAGSFLAQKPGVLGQLGTSLSSLGTGAAAGGTAATGAAASGAAGAGGAAALGGPLGIVAALGMAALQGTNRKRSKQSAENLMQNTMSDSLQMANNGANDAMSDQNQINPIYENSLANAGLTQPIAAGQETGAAAPLQTGISQNNYQTPSEVAQQAQLPIMSGETQQTQQAQPTGFIGKLASGLGDFSRGYQENLNNSFNPNNLTADKFTETITIPGNAKLMEGYAKSLKTQGYSDDVIEGMREGKNSGIRPIAEYINAHPEMYDKTITNTYDKGKMARLGEFAGSLARFSQKPGVQALIAGGLSTALTGNPMYGLGQAYKFGSQRAKNSVYEQALQKYGISPNTGFFGTVGPQDLNAIGNLYYKKLLDIYRNKQLEEQKAYHQGTLEQKVRANDTKNGKGKGTNNGGGNSSNTVSNGSINSKNLSNYQKDMEIVTPLRDKILSGNATPEEKQKYKAMAGELTRRYGKNFYNKGLSLQKAPKKEKLTAPGL